MTAQLLYAACGVLLFAIGLLALVIEPHVIKKVLAVNVAGIGVFMVFVANAAGADGVTDPVPHALVLTGIVVAVAGSALALSLACRLKSVMHQKDEEA